MRFTQNLAERFYWRPTLGNDLQTTQRLYHKQTLNGIYSMAGLFMEDPLR